MIHQAHPDGGRLRYFGLYPALVTDLVDPESLGRVQVSLPSLGQEGSEDLRAWATLLSPYADDQQGFLALPEVDSQVVVAFEAGDLRRPYIVGACWNGREALPEQPSRDNGKKVLQSRSGNRVELDDRAAGACITVTTPDGHRLELDDRERTVRLRHSEGIEIVLTGAGAVEIRANLQVEVKAPMVQVKSPMAKFDGIVHCQTLIADAAVVSPSYTPGAGNVW